jgi:hypothetical protein
MQLPHHPVSLYNSLAGADRSTMDSTTTLPPDASRRLSISQLLLRLAEPETVVNVVPSNHRLASRILHWIHVCLNLLVAFIILGLYVCINIILLIGELNWHCLGYLGRGICYVYRSILDGYNDVLYYPLSSRPSASATITIFIPPWRQSFEIAL